MNAVQATDCLLGASAGHAVHVAERRAAVYAVGSESAYEAHAVRDAVVTFLFFGVLQVETRSIVCEARKAGVPVVAKDA